MRIGIVGLLHESNTFVSRPTTIEQFRENALLLGSDAIRSHFGSSHHELGGFLSGLDARSETESEPIECVPIFAARALPAGVIAASSWNELTSTMLQAVETTLQSAPLDGVLVAPHGATVSEEHPDADGHWLTLLRSLVGPKTWIGGTLDLHANLSPAMTDACNFLTAYRSNPHLDQKARGVEAANLMVDAISGRCRPVMGAEFPPLAIAIDRQDTAAPWLAEVYQLAATLRGEHPPSDRELVAGSKTNVDGGQQPARMLSTSLLLGFPYADVHEMGAATIAVADNDELAAASAANLLANALIERRESYRSELVDVEAALDQCENLPTPICLLDMGDNVGGGSAADGTSLLAGLLRRSMTSFVCLCDPDSVLQAERAGVGCTVNMQLGGKTDNIHGEPITVQCKVASLHDGKFSESQPRHGGMTHFDQGPTAIVRTGNVSIMLTSKRMVPFSLQQLYACGLDPTQFQVLAAKGVHAPLAAYREVCHSILRVNTPGSTSADMHSLKYEHRRHPLFPFESPF